MLPFTHRAAAVMRPELKLPTLLLSRYLFFLTRRPISRSNLHYLHRRIHGLQALRDVVADVDDGAGGAQVTRLLQSLSPTNLHEVAERIQLLLLRSTQTVLPIDYVSIDGAPPPEFLLDNDRILLVLGPAIGIGDEIVVQPLPRWIKTANPRVEVAVLTGYSGLWDRVAGVDTVVTYSDCAALVDAMRGRGPHGRFDAVLLIDFEHPELFEAVTYEPDVHRYAEISLGARQLAAVDLERRSLYRFGPPRGYFRNVYRAFDLLAGALGMTPDDRFAGRANAGAVGDPLRIFVSPFSSKYEPSLRYWSRLLESLVSADERLRASIAVDSGPSLTTRRFAADLCRAVGRFRRDDVPIDIAESPGSHSLSIAGAVERLAEADVAICADSFTAHLAPLMDCTTLVLVSSGLEEWRVPSVRSFYFDAALPLADVVAGMRHVIDWVRAGDAGLRHATDDEARLRLAARELEAALDKDDDTLGPVVVAAYSDLLAVRTEVVDHWSTLGPGARALLSDHQYRLRPRDSRDIELDSGRLEPEMRSYVLNQLLSWRTTNLAKCVELLGAAAEP
jgi:ADP-heptose:LPS heptosyltransferase